MTDRFKQEYEGILAEDIEDNSVIAYIELTGLLVNVLDSNKVSRKDSTQTLNYGKGNQTSVTRTTVITARFDDAQANQPYRPALKQGNRAIAWRYSDSDDWYWRADDRDKSSKTTDRFRQEVAAKEKLDSEPLTDDNSYFYELNSQEGHVIIKTSSVNGEEFRYTLSFKTKEDGSNGIFLGDNDGNAFQLNTNAKTMSMTNSSGSSIALMDKNIVISCEGSIHIKAKDHIRMKSTHLSGNIKNTISFTANSLKFLITNVTSISARIISLLTKSRGVGITNGKFWSNFRFEAPSILCSGSIKTGPSTAPGYGSPVSPPSIDNSSPDEAPKTPGQDAR